MNEPEVAKILTMVHGDLNFHSLVTKAVALRDSSIMVQVNGIGNQSRNRSNFRDRPKAGFRRHLYFRRVAMRQCILCRTEV